MLYRSVESSDIYGAGSRLFVCLLLVHGVSTAVGHYTVRLAHLSGYKSVATASPENRAVLKSLGADVVFDCRPDFSAKIKAITGDTIRIALDCFSSPESQKFSAKAICTEASKAFLGTEPDPEAAAIRSQVSLQ